LSSRAWRSNCFFKFLKREFSAFIDMHSRQLYVAHQVAVYCKLPRGGLSADAKLLEKVVAANYASMSALLRMVKGREINEVLAALECAGYEIKYAQVVDFRVLKCLSCL
jgi:hypothetical protein